MLRRIFLMINKSAIRSILASVSASGGYCEALKKYIAASEIDNIKKYIKVLKTLSSEKQIQGMKDWYNREYLIWKGEDEVLSKAENQALFELIEKVDNSREFAAFISDIYYKERLLRGERWYKSKRRGYVKACRFYRDIYGRNPKNEDNIKMCGVKSEKNMLGIFRKTRAGKYFNKDYDYTHRRQIINNDIMWKDLQNEYEGYLNLKKTIIPRYKR